MRRKHKKAYKELMNTEQLESAGEKLPLHELHNVQKETRKEFKRRASLFKRMGETAMLVSGLVTSRLYARLSGLSNDPEKLRRAGKEHARTKGARGNEAAYLAIHGSLMQEKRDKQWREAQEKAETKFREEHPEVARREEQLHSERKERARRKGIISIKDRVARHAYNTADYFRHRSLGSFAKGMPWKPGQGRKEGFTGSYTELAKDTLSEATSRRTEDGTVPLLGVALQAERVSERVAAGDSVDDIKKSEIGYAEGATTALWKLGFVEFRNYKDEPISDDEDVHGGAVSGRYNPDLQWERDSENQTVTARIPYDPENELHQTLAGDKEFSHPMVEVEMPMNPFDGMHGNRNQSSYMNLKVAEEFPANTPPVVEYLLSNSRS